MAETKIRDFSRRASSLEFTADGETHVPHPTLPPESLSELRQLMHGRNLTDDLAILDDIFGIMFPPSEAAKISVRLRKDAKNPLGLGQIVDIIEWLVEEYGQRPTKPSAGSSTTSQAEIDESGTSLTAGVLLETLTPSS